MCVLGARVTLAPHKHANPERNMYTLARVTMGAGCGSLDIAMGGKSKCFVCNGKGSRVCSVCDGIGFV